MGQESNDIQQLERCLKDLSNVYKSQVAVGEADITLLTNMNNAVVGTNEALKILRKQTK